MSLAEWRAMVRGFYQRRRRERFDQAWGVSYTLMAAGCGAADVSPHKLLGLVSPEEKQARKKVKKAVQRMKLRQGPDPDFLRLVSAMTKGKVAADLLRTAESEGQDAAEQ